MSINFSLVFSAGKPLNIQVVLYSCKFSFPKVSILFFLKLITNNTWTFAVLFLTLLSNTANMNRGIFKEERGLSNIVQFRIQRNRGAKLIFFCERWRSINPIGKLKNERKWKFYIGMYIMKLLHKQDLVFSSVCYIKIIVLQGTFLWFLKVKKKPLGGVLKMVFLLPAIVDIFMNILVLEEQLNRLGRWFLVTGL